MSEQDQAPEATNSELGIDNLPEGVDDPQVLRAELAKKDKAIRQIHARAIKAETLLKERAPEKETITTSTPTGQVTLNDEVVDLRLDGYSKQEVEWIMNNGGRKVLDDPNSLVSIAIKAQREQLRAEQAADDTNSNVGLSEIERKYTPEQLRNMPLKELEALLPRA